MQIIKFILLPFFLFPTLSAFCEQPSLHTLSSTFHSLIHSTDEAHRLSYSEAFTQDALKIMSSDPDFRFPFDSIPNLRVFSAKDKSFRILNWVILKDEGTVKHKALLQVFNKPKKIYEIHTLEDISAQCEDSEQFIGNPDNWFGALYSQLVETKYNDKTYYTLLGWNGSDALCNRKVVENLIIKPNGEIVFGSPLFKMGKNLQKRVVFRMGKGNDMILRYDFQAYTKKEAPKKKGVNPVITEIPANLIIFDRLVPLQDHLQNEYSFYIPAGGVYDGLFFDQGKWNLKMNVEARNPNPVPPAKKRGERPKLYEPPK